MMPCQPATTTTTPEPTRRPSLAGTWSLPPCPTTGVDPRHVQRLELSAGRRLVAVRTHLGANFSSYEASGWLQPGLRNYAKVQLMKRSPRGTRGWSGAARRAGCTVAAAPLARPVGHPRTTPTSHSE